ncbi:MAG TPA: hypothetical protein PL009_13620 [Flavipsychrobacter sp.]|nr:hypothetical protein [Flavipsychrobacter sp.]
MKEFTNRYSLSKTLRFELKPMGADGKQLPSDEAMKMLTKIIEEDKKIKAAYVALKPVMDKIHEQVINSSLISEEAKATNVTDYFNEYKKGKNKQTEAFELSMRERIGLLLEYGANDFANEANKNADSPIFKKKKEKDVGTEYLTQAGILKYIAGNLNSLVAVEHKAEIENHLKTVAKFFMYFEGYNQARENYYEEGGEKTSVASRIVDENLPRFCDNAIQFSESKTRKKKNSNEIITIPSRKDEYLNIYQYLKDIKRITQIKDAATNKMIEADPIEEKTFLIGNFVNCLAQNGIEEYNRVIGHYNSLIILYNQARKGEPDFRKLDQFKTLYKQIGCGEKKDWIKGLKYNTEQEQKGKEPKATEVLSVEGTLKLIANAGKKYFAQQDDDHIVTIHKFIDWLKEVDDWDGIYWSKAAVDKISNQYFESWQELKEQLKGNKACVTYDKKREEPLKINDAVELSGLFEVLDKDQQEGWSERFFKASIMEERASLINESQKPSQNLINLICADISDNATRFCEQADGILQITDYSNEDNILLIKQWLDRSILVLRIIKYFEVKESKVKGHSINPNLTNMLNAIVRAEDANWFNQYDLVRNHLTKKPQDDAKKNKLKLNFGNPILVGGWSDGQEINKSTVLLKHNNKYYVGLLMNRSLFDTSKENNPIYKSSDKSVGRLILSNLKFQTLAGKGFVRDYQERYGHIGQRNPLEAVRKLQAFIQQYYVKQYPLLQQVTNKKYEDKKTFDKEIQEVLTECYECSFTPIDWNKVLEHVEQNELYLFEIYSKDFSENKGEKSNDSKLNLQTKYWQHIFDDNSTIQLCGGGELFYREKAIKDENIVKHAKHQPIFRRSDGKTQSQFKHDIVKDKRFTIDKFLFHVPIKINYQAPSPRQVKLNEAVNDNFTQTDDILFLGIDRGEKHLIYYSLVDINGNIVEDGQGHFDTINGKDYLKAIKEAADLRKKKQENWQQKGNISNLKDGYMSLVVHEIIQKMKDKQSGKYRPMFIVLENLNTGFKRGRQKFEEQVYQKFETALAKKLNYLVDKNAAIGALGSVSHALQLTPLITNYQDIENRKQVGVLLYTRANYTSVTDPVTGWRKSIYLKKGSETCRLPSNS